MTIRLIIIPDGISTTAVPPTENHRFRLVGTDDQNVATSYVMGGTPNLVTTNWGILYRQDLELNRTAYNQWDVEIPYAKDINDTGEWSWDFDTTGGTVKITQARQEVSRYPAGSAPDQQGAIAVDGNEVKGVEIVVPAMRVNVTYRYPEGAITLSQAKYLSDITGTVNNDSFLTFAPGQVLFLGARGGDGTNSESVVSYQFAMAANESGLNIGNIGGVDKEGWEVAWIRYQDTITVVEGDDKPTRVPQYVYVDRVYEQIPMAVSLGFG